MASKLVMFIGMMVAVVTTACEASSKCGDLGDQCSSDDGCCGLSTCCINKSYCETDPAKCLMYWCQLYEEMNGPCPKGYTCGYAPPCKHCSPSVECIKNSTTPYTGD